MKDFIQINKFSRLHNTQNIIFCKTDYLIQEFRDISKLNKPIILISGNSDYPITDKIVSQAPKNIKKWFAQNALSYSDILEPIPIGLENKIESNRYGHGIGYGHRVSETENLLNRNLDIEPTKNIYANFNVNTNFDYRNNIKTLCIKSTEIIWEEPVLSPKKWFDTILQYKMVVCPIGNGIDTHRLWETLYCNRIPITIKAGNYQIYKLYEQLPVIILDAPEDLNNFDLIIKKYDIITKTKYNMNLLDINHWITKIRNNI